MIKAYRLLIGSIGDDSHSVGMTLLEIAFREAGFLVKNLGILNRLEDFFYHAGNFDAVFISCMNGHADLYFDDFPFHLKKYNQRNPTPGVWYLGGNLSVRDSSESVVRKYRQMGFDFVSPKPISCEAIMENLYKDFYKKGIKKKRRHPPESPPPIQETLLETVDDDPMADEEFHAQREAVLSSWPTGEQVWDADIAGNHSWDHKNLHNIIVYQQAKDARPLVQPRTGVAHVEDEIDLLKFLREKGLDVSSIQLDAASRKKMFRKAEEGVQKTGKGKASFLNGYPVPIHGVGGMKAILQAIETPFQVRAGSPDHRLVYEIGLAGGASSIEGGFICYLFPYDKNTSPIQSLRYWKYVDKLTDWYRRKFDVLINREYFGPLTCCLIEPAIPICINIVQALLSAKSGVKCISVGLAEQGNRSQDIAAVRVLEKMTRRYLAACGFHHCTVSTVYHHYMAAFPTDIRKSRDLILHSSVTGALAGATRMMTKTPVESHHIPTKEDNAEGLKLTRKGILAAANAKINREIVEKEMQLLEREVGSIMEKIEKLGRGSLARGAVKAFETGVLDIPFSPSTFNKGQLITARDCDGAIRFVNPERLPFKEDLIDFHKEKIHRRMKEEGARKIFEILERDLTRVWKNDFSRWPLDGHYVC